MTKKALLIYKKSQYQIYVKEKQNSHIKNLVANSSSVTSGLLASHDAHQQNLEEIVKILQKNYDLRTRYRGSMDMVKDADIVFSAGGDGTLLWAQKFIGPNIPVVGINSDPVRSHGALLFATAQDLKEKLEIINKKSPEIISRLEVLVNDTPVRSRILNDVLFCHKHPAAMSVFVSPKTDNASEQIIKCSGIWISSAIGSTGAISSAGGSVQDKRSSFFQSKIREPFGNSGKHFSRFFSREEEFTLLSKMREGLLSFDGFRDSMGVEMGDKVTFRNSKETLSLYVK